MSLSATPSKKGWSGSTKKSCPFGSEEVISIAISHPFPVEFDVVLEKGETGAWVADVPMLPGCHTQGRSPKEALQNVREAIQLYLDVKGVPPGRVVRIERVRVEA